MIVNCIDCKKEIINRKAKRCIPCANIQHRTLIKKTCIESTSKKIYKEIQCKKCDKTFVPHKKTQIFCHNPCTSRKNNIEIFLTKKPSIQRKKSSVHWAFKTKDLIKNMKMEL